MRNENAALKPGHGPERFLASREQGKQMLNYDDCLPLAHLNDEEQRALRRNPLAPDEIVLKLGRYVVLIEYGLPTIRQILLEDLHHADNDPRKRATLWLLVKMFVDSHLGRGIIFS